MISQWQVLEEELDQFSSEESETSVIISSIEMCDLSRANRTQL